MKKFFTLLVLAACCAAMTWGCSDDKYDDTEIRQEIENLKQEIASMKEQVGRNARFLRPDRCRGDPHRQPLVGNGFLDLHAGPSPTLRTDLERDRLQL